MSWRILHIAKQCKLSVKDKQLFYQTEEESFTIPMEDISVVVLESLHSLLSSSIISAFADNNIVMFTCDSAHMPNGALFSFHNHSRYLETAEQQINMSEPLKKRIWQSIITRKIFNQSQALKLFQRQNADKLESMSKNVKSGDSGNMESTAANIYWKSLIDNFNRNDDLNPINALLNYGYAILRGCVARSLVGAGLLPCFGIFHRNMLNQFNLADDIIEPFRPFVDIEVCRIITISPKITELTPAIKKQLISVLTNNCIYDNEVKTILKACESAAFATAKTIKTKDIKNMQLPYIYEEA